MKSLIRWAIHNSPAMNTLMLTVLAVGAASMFLMRREMFPEFELEIILVSVPYPGASPAEVEDGICQKLEEAVRSIDGIKKQTAIAQEGAGFLVLELTTDGPSVQKTLNEVRSEIDRIRSFPDLSEDAQVKQITLRQTAIRVGVLGPDELTSAAELNLRELTEQVRHDLLDLPAVSQASIIGARDYQIDIEIPESTLRQHNLSLQRVAEIVRRENIEMPGGSMRMESQEVLLRGKNKHLTGEEIAKIPLVSQPNGVVLTIADLGRVKDEFTDEPAFNLINGQPGLVISIQRTAREDLLAITEQVHDYVTSTRLPEGYRFYTWQDTAVDVRDRIQLLRKNGLQGLILVFLVLAAFLDLRLAFWVALGVPVAVLGACGALLAADQTINMLSLFAFLLALGIVVDDAIVIGENIYSHRQQGKDLVNAAIDGAVEVLPSVAASVTTTIIAFTPMLFVSGVMGKFIAVMPLAVIAMLVISLVESTLILPCHLGHEHTGFFRILGFALYPFRPLALLFHRLTAWTDRVQYFLAHRFYLPSLERVIRSPAIFISICISTLLVTAAFVPAGVTPWNVFPKLDSKWIEAKVTFPDGTPAGITEEATQQLAAALEQVNLKQMEAVPSAQPLVRLVHRCVGQIVGPEMIGPEPRSNGSHLGLVFVELSDPAERTVQSDEILDRWRRATGTISGADSVIFGSPDFGPGGRPIEFKLTAPPDEMEQLEQAVERTKAELAQTQRYPGVVDIVDDSRPGKWEYQLRIKDTAKSLGVSTADLAETVRASYYGAEAMRLQRGRHEVKLMVRYPEQYRRSLVSLENIQIRGTDQVERPLSELATVRVVRGYSEINRVDQVRSITITADIREKEGNARAVVGRLRSEFLPQLQAAFPDIRVRWEGQQEQSRESVRSLLKGFAVAVLAMYALLTLEFRSYLQPLIILLIIPFGLVGALWGHALLGLQVSMLSLFGMVALTGVVVNDSIVLIDFVNKRIAAGDPLVRALTTAGARRFRAVLLTSLTTIAGLTPLLLETSFQAQLLIPMATSLCFGLMVATVVVLYLVPVIYGLYGRIVLTSPEEPASPTVAGLPAAAVERKGHG